MAIPDPTAPPGILHLRRHRNGGWTVRVGERRTTHAACSSTDDMLAVLDALLRPPAATPTIETFRTPVGGVPDPAPRPVKSGGAA